MGDKELVMEENKDEAISDKFIYENFRDLYEKKLKPQLEEANQIIQLIHIGTQYNHITSHTRTLIINYKKKYFEKA